MREKFILWLTFDRELALTGFRTTRPGDKSMNKNKDCIYCYPLLIS